MGDDKGKQLKDSTWVCKAPVKESEFDLERAREIFMEAKKSFVDASTSGSKDRLDPEMDPSMCDRKVVKGLQELINRCVGTAPGEPCVIRKIGKHKMRTRRETRLTT